jgi:TonB-dependent SusC/RagA subfamily outer membrane receptor
LYIVDGVIVNNATNRVTNTSSNYDGGNFVGSIGQNRMVDINPADIERIEVLNGAAAAATYGSRANAGVIQILLSLLRAGFIAFFFPSSVIRGMLAGIGLIIIIKQFPHAVGYDLTFEGDETLPSLFSGNVLETFFAMFERVTYGAIVIALISTALTLMALSWRRRRRRDLALVSALGRIELNMAVLDRKIEEHR